MQTRRAQRVLSAFRGSSWPALVQTEEQKLVVKLRGTAQGLLPLVAALVVGALADALGLGTPERYLVELGAGLPSDEPHEELGALPRCSGGTAASCALAASGTVRAEPSRRCSASRVIFA